MSLLGDSDPDMQLQTCKGPTAAENCASLKRRPAAEIVPR